MIYFIFIQQQDPLFPLPAALRPQNALPPSPPNFALNSHFFKIYMLLIFHVHGLGLRQEDNKFENDLVLSTY